MKTFLIALLCIVWAHTVSAECVVVTPYNWSLTAQPSSGNVQVTVNLDGKPLPSAKVLVSLINGYQEQFLFSVSADDHGVARLPDLKPGRYHVIGMTANGIQSDLLLDVSAKAAKNASLFSVNLLNIFALPYFGGQQLAKLEAAPSERFPKFTGTVVDQSGAAVAGAEIEIYPAGTWDRASLVHVIVDQDGHFSAKLPDGAYRAIIHMAGFKPYPVVFRIQHDGDPKEFAAVLEVASC